MHKLKEAAQRMVDAFAPHADKCRPCTIEWQNLKEALEKQEWVGLTDEDIEDCYIEELYLFAVALEAKLKEKNT